jgi:hypothetical protein
MLKRQKILSWSRESREAHRNKYGNPMGMKGFVCQSTTAITTIKVAAATDNRLSLSSE